MTQATQPPDQWFGAIAHTELGSNDPAATTKFLSDVFDMCFETTPGPMGMAYHMAHTEGRPSCGVRQSMPQENGPSQTPYISVEDLGATLEKVTTNGGTIMLPTTAIPGQGWMAWIQAPGGNFLACWQSDPDAA